MSERIEKVMVPDLGESSNVDVIEVLVKPGDQIAEEDSIITLEGDKATMEVPSPLAGVVDSIKIKVGDKVSTGDFILQLKVGDAAKQASTSKAAPADKGNSEVGTQTALQTKGQAATAASAPRISESSVDEIDSGDDAGADVHAGPAVRRIAREFGVDLTRIQGSGAKGRVVKEDVQAFVKQQIRLADQGGGSGLAVAAQPKIDFSQFGEVEVQPLSKIQKISGPTLHRNWVSIPHVTQFGEADVTGLEAFRQKHKQEAIDQGSRLTMIAFLMKAVEKALQKFPNFNASLDANGESIVLKKYFNIGVAVDTPNGLVVPVIRNVDQKGLFDIGKELMAISQKARKTGLGLNDMQGGCFTISSLGGIGGTAFTPIINAPEVAILGVSKAETKAVYMKGEFVPRLMLPLSLSYDHRVIDGADGARFLVYLTELLADIRTVLL